MKILQIIPGSGGSFYCGNCLRDDKFYESIKRLGHDVIKIPMYLPLFANGDVNQNHIPVFYGAVSLYLKQQFPFLRRFPKSFDRLMNSKAMLRMAAKRSGSTDAKGLEAMTISMLKGEDGNQSSELDEMVSWIESHYKPDVIHISNALLLGLAHQLKSRLNVPVVCSLQDEDVWVNAMEPQKANEVWNLMAEKAKDVDAFIAVSDYFAEFSKVNIKIPTEKMHRVYLGVHPDNYVFKNAAEKERKIGFISRLCYENGLDILLEAFIGLKKDPDYKDVKLVLTGGYTGADKSFLRRIRKLITKHNLDSEIEWQEKFNNEERLKFFEKVQVLSVPVRGGEAFGIYLTESLASGIPVIQPNEGAFPEIVEKTNGGLIYEKNNAKELQKKLEEILSGKHDISELSEFARKGVEEEFHIQKLSQKIVDVYQSLS